MLGGARSGKSRFAQKMAEGLSEKVLFVATAEGLDEEMRARIQEHRRTRLTKWRTVEAPRAVAEFVRQNLEEAEVVLVDCVTLLVSNLLTGGSETGQPGCEHFVVGEVRGLIKLMDEAGATFVIVSNEVGLGLVPDNALGRDYRDTLGKVNQMLSARADEVYFLVSGIPLKIKDRISPAPLLSLLESLQNTTL